MINGVKGLFEIYENYTVDKAIVDIGVTLANFHLSGKIPVSIDLAKISVRDGETMLAAIFNTLFGILSSPAESTRYQRT